MRSCFRLVLFKIYIIWGGDSVNCFVMYGKRNSHLKLPLWLNKPNKRCEESLFLNSKKFFVVKTYSVVKLCCFSNNLKFPNIEEYGKCVLYEGK